MARMHSFRHLYINHYILYFFPFYFILFIFTHLSFLTQAISNPGTDVDVPIPPDYEEPTSEGELSAYQLLYEKIKGGESVESITELIDKFKIKINSQNIYGETFLHIAAKMNEPIMGIEQYLLLIETLVEKGADPNIKTYSKGESVIDYVIKFKPEIARMLKTFFKPKTPIHQIVVQSFKKNSNNSLLATFKILKFKIHKIFSKHTVQSIHFNQTLYQEFKKKPLSILKIVKQLIVLQKILNQQYANNPIDQNIDQKTENHVKCSKILKKPTN